jgi:hypothetical protein
MTPVTGCTAHLVRWELAPVILVAIGWLAPQQQPVSSTVQPMVQVSAPTPFQDMARGSVAVTGHASGDVSVASVQVGIENQQTNLWQHVGGAWGSKALQPATLSNPGATSTSYSLNLPSLPAGHYLLQVNAVATTGTSSAITSSYFQVHNAAATGPGYITILFGRTMYSNADSSCNELPGSVTLDQIAQDLHNRGLNAAGVVVVDRTQATSPLCYQRSLYSTWSEQATLRQTDGWSFVSGGMTHNDITQMTPSQQYAESCGSLAYLAENGDTHANALYAYSDNLFKTAIQTNVVSTCFDYGRTYRGGWNIRSSMRPPWLQTTNSFLGGACNDPSQPCYNINAKGARYASPVAISKLLQVGGDDWEVVQFYKMVSGASLTTSPAWDCTNANWQEHWTTQPETYCINDFDAAISTIPASAIVTNPATVAAAWGRAVSNIAGTITAQGNSQPIAGATVTWNGGSTTTDATGGYTLSSVTPGIDPVTVTAATYQQQTANVNVTAGDTALQNFSLSHHPVFSDGFESDNFSAWTSSKGLAVEATIVHSGAFAAEVNTSHGGGSALKKLPSTYTTGYGRVWFDIVSESSQLNVLRLNNSLNAPIACLYVTQSKRLGMTADGINTLSTTTVSTGTFHEIELAVTVNGTSSTTQVWFDGTRVSLLSRTVSLGTSPIAQFQVGPVQSAGTYNLVVDDAAFDTMLLP